jgi:hypothetical protein
LESKSRKERKEKKPETVEGENDIQCNEGEKVLEKRRWAIPKDNLKTPEKLAPELLSIFTYPLHRINN